MTKDLETMEEKVKKANSLHKDLNELLNSEDFMSDDAYDECLKALAREEIELQDVKQKLMNAVKIQTQIQSIKHNPNFMTEDVISKDSEKIEISRMYLRKMIGNTLSNKSFDKIVRAHMEACGELQCVVCFEVPPAEVFTCKENHILCHECKPRVLHQCPVCRQSFTISPPTRNRLAEKIILKLL